MQADLLGSPVRERTLSGFFSRSTHAIEAGQRLYIAEKQDGHTILRAAMVREIGMVPDGRGTLSPAYMLEGRGVPHVLMKDVVDAVSAATWEGRDVVASGIFAVADKAYQIGAGISDRHIKPKSTYS